MNDVHICTVGKEWELEKDRIERASQGNIKSQKYIIFYEHETGTVYSKEIQCFLL